MSANQLQQAQALTLPSREAMLQRAPSVQRFWDDNQELLLSAWQQWEQNNQSQLPALDESLIAPELRSAIEKAWRDPNSESVVKDLWQEVSPGVFQIQFFDPAKLAQLRSYLDSAADAGIPRRPPYGIVLNRYGSMLDPRSEGYFAAPSFQDFYQMLMDKYMRPVARLLFPEVYGFDNQTFGFSIQYQAGMDTSLRLHTDASAATLNINLNLPDEEYTGSEVDFFDPVNNTTNRVVFEPGTAMLHRGSVAHAAQPITSGTRSNFVLWLYGNRGQIPMRNLAATDIDAKQRWSVPTSAKDFIAPF